MGREQVRRFGVVGASVGHSLSPAMHTAAFGHMGMAAVYLPMDVPEGALARAWHGAWRLGFAGLNVTAPHKEGAFAMGTVATEAARQARSANVVAFAPDGSTRIDSTDGEAVTGALDARDPGWAARCTSLSPALVLGAGGAARAGAVALCGRGAAVAVAARRPEAAADLCALLRSLGGRAQPVAWETRRAVAAGAPVVLQGTPLGGGRRQKGDPLAPGALPGPRGILVELAYGAAPTPLEARARAAGLAVVDGREVLARQGSASWRLWFGVPGPLAVMWAATGAVSGERLS